MRSAIPPSGRGSGDTLLMQGGDIGIYVCTHNEQGPACLSDANPERVGDHVVHGPQQWVSSVSDEHNIEMAVSTSSRNRGG